MNSRCVKGYSPSGECTAAWTCGKPVSCCIECIGQCGNFCGWVGKERERNIKRYRRRLMGKSMVQVKAIEKRNKERMLKANPALTDESGIYFLTRSEPHAYIGQAKHVLTRLAQHLSGFQYIDNSIRAHGLYSEDNPGGYRVNFLPCPENQLDELERHFIEVYAKNGYKLKNLTSGGQGEGKTKIGEYRPAKGYRDGLKQGARNMARELAHIMDKHLSVTLKPGKENNKVSQKAFEKFKAILEDGKET